MTYDYDQMAVVATLRISEVFNFFSSFRFEKQSCVILVKPFLEWCECDCLAKISTNRTNRTITGMLFLSYMIILQKMIIDTYVRTFLKCS